MRIAKVDVEAPMDAAIHKHKERLERALASASSTEEFNQLVAKSRAKWRREWGVSRVG